MINQNTRGHTSELGCLLCFTELGYQVSLPFGGQARYDFIADIDGKLIKVQVKSSIVTEEYLEFDCRNSVSIQGKRVHQTYSKEEIDFFATYANGKTYLVPIEECSVEKRLRFLPPKNNQTKRINFAKDYELSEVVKRL